MRILCDVCESTIFLFSKYQSDSISLICSHCKYDNTYRLKEYYNKYRPNTIFINPESISSESDINAIVESHGISPDEVYAIEKMQEYFNLGFSIDEIYDYNEE